MSVQVKIPAVGESISSGVVSVWHKKSVERVKKGDPLFSLETDKVSTEIVAETDGVLRTKAAEGQEVKIGEVVAEIEESSAAEAAPTNKEKGAPQQASVAADADRGQPVDDQRMRHERGAGIARLRAGTIHKEEWVETWFHVFLR